MSSTQADYLVTATVDGVPLGAFDQFSGGEVDSDLSSRQTSQGRRVYKTRKVTYGDVTITRSFEKERDWELSRTLERRVGRADISVSRQPVDVDGNAWGKPKTYTGVLKTVTPMDADTDSTDPDDFQIVATIETVV